MEIIVMVTVPQENREDLTRVILEKRCAACVNVLENVRSYYWWQGRQEQSTEALLLIKTRKELFPALEELIRTHHPYDVPEIVAFDITEGSRPYLRWLREETGG